MRKVTLALLVAVTLSGGVAVGTAAADQPQNTMVSADGFGWD